uniref:F-box associated domain-containing protein n=1 Tax=Aegilops tauschii subsp. strangulata TaxID=200361 RepID=A0A453JSL1_AEGTS
MIWFCRISLSDTAYHVIKPPFDIKVKDCCLHTDIVRSEKGVYFVAFEDDKCWLRVWILNESCGQMEWMLKHDKDLNPVLARHRFDQRVHGPWILEDINYNLFRSSHSSNDIKEASTEQIYEWNSDNDDDDVENCHRNKDGRRKEYDIQILGFHPHKEIVFMSESQETGLAYHLNGSKIEVLGSIYPKEYSCFKELLNDMEYFTSFPYTPCWIEEFPQNN